MPRVKRKLKTRGRYHKKMTLALRKRKNRFKAKRRRHQNRANKKRGGKK